MRKLGFVLLCAMGLTAAGEPPPVDMAALPKAQAAREEFRNRCDARANSFASTSAYMECFLAVDKAFVATAKVRDPRFYDNFSLVVRKAVADQAAGKISAAGLVDAYRALWQELQDEILAQQDTFMSRRATTRGPAMDMAAEPAAHKAEGAAMRHCASLKENGTARFECLLAATRAYAVVVKFRDMYRLDTFDAKIRLAVADRARGDLTAAQLADRFQSLHDDLFVNAAKETLK